MAEYDAQRDVYRVEGGSTFESRADAEAYESWREQRNYEREREDRRAEQATRIDEICSKAVSQVVLYKLPAGMQLFQSGNYNDALSYLEFSLHCIDNARIVDVFVRKNEHYVNNPTLNEINKKLRVDMNRQQWVLTLMQKVALCYFKQAELSMGTGDYGKALSRYLIARAYQYDDKEALNRLINEAIDKLSEQALSGDDVALKALMDIYALSVTTEGIEMSFGKEDPMEYFTLWNRNPNFFSRPAELCIQLAEQGRARAAVLLAEYYGNFHNSIGLTRIQRSVEYHRIKRRRELYKKAIALYKEEAIASSSEDVKRNLKNVNKNIRKTMKTMVRYYMHRPRKFFAFINFFITLGVMMGASLLYMKFFSEDSAVALFMKFFGMDYRVGLIVVIGITFLVSFILFFQLWVRRVFIGIALVLLLSAAGYKYAIIPALGF